MRRKISIQFGLTIARLYSLLIWSFRLTRRTLSSTRFVLRMSHGMILLKHIGWVMECSTLAMSNSSDHYMHRHCVERTYGASSDQHPQNAMTMAQVADRLVEYLNPGSLWVEWSQGFCDYSRVLQALKKLGRASMMPLISNVFRLNLAWRCALTGLNVFISTICALSYDGQVWCRAVSSSAQS